MRYSSTILMVLAFLSFLSCEKDKALKRPLEDPSLGKCPGFNSGCNIGPTFRDKFPAYIRTVFDPVDGSALIMNRQTSSGYEILKYNMGSGEEIILQEGVRSASDLSWSTTGWIAFSTVSNWNIWKMREDGSGLTQLSNTPQDLSPEFHPDGDKLIYSRDMQYSNFKLDSNPQLRYQYKVMLINLNGDSLDSFCREVGDDPCYPWSKASWAPDGERIAAPDGSVAPNKGLALYDLEGKRLPHEFDLPGEKITKISDIEWHPDNERVFFIYWAERNVHGGIVVWTPSSGRTKILRKGCEDHYYRDLTISPDGQQLVAIRVEATLENCQITRATKPVIMDIDGGNERVLEIE